MKQESHRTGFYIETLLLILVFVLILLLLTRVFGMSRVESSEARLLNSAVCLARNAAEAASAADSPEALCRLLDQGGNASAEQGLVRAAYDEDMRPDASGPLLVDVSWEPQPMQGGSLVTCRIRVRQREAASPVYELETAVYLRGDGA